MKKIIIKETYRLFQMLAMTLIVGHYGFNCNLLLEVLI